MRTECWNPALACVLIVFFCLGCGTPPAKDLPSTVPVSGKVTLNGQPLGLASISFIPREGTAGIECRGLTDAEGKYQLKQARGGEGAPPGDYSVAISRYMTPDGKPLPLTADSPQPADVGAVESLPPRYSDFSRTQLTATVPAGGGTVDFDLKTK